MIRTIIGYHLNDKEKKLYTWQTNDYVEYDHKYALEKGELYAIVNSNKQIQLIKVVGYGEVVEGCVLKKAVALVELDNADI